MQTQLPITDYQLPHPSPRRAFTLIELMVAVSLLVVVILSVGIVFKSTGNAVGLGQATGEMFAKVRAINQQIVADVHGIDRNGFLIIRCQAELQTDSDYQSDRFRRYDQISFISTGKFPNRTGSSTSATIFSDNSTSNSARIWYGQLLLQKDGASDESTAIPASYRPTLPGPAATLGIIPNSLVGPRSIYADYAGTPFDPAYESGFTLGRQAMLLLNPPAGTPSVAGFTTIVDTATMTGASDAAGESSKAVSIVASRVGVAYTTVPQIMASLAGAAPTATGYCYRLKTLPSPTATNVLSGSDPYLPNGVLRMHPILSQGVPSFAVDWTDGTVDANGDLHWYGANTGSTGTNMYSDNVATNAAPYTLPPYTAATNSTITGYASPTPAIESGSVNGDIYEAVFTPANRTLWPKALRFTYRITDSNDRLNGGRSFVCVVDLP